MRALLAIVPILAGAAALAPAADAQYRQRSPNYYAPSPPSYGEPSYGYRQPGYKSRKQLVCEERAFAEDPAGQYAGYPCWAREAFGRSPGGRGN